MDEGGYPQLELFGSSEVPPRGPSEVELTLAQLEPDHMTPMDALMAIARLKDLLTLEDEDADEPGH